MRRRRRGRAPACRLPLTPKGCTRALAATGALRAEIRKSVSGTVSQATGSPSQANSTVRIDKPGRPPVANQAAPPAAAPGVTTSAAPREPSVTTITVEPATPLDNVAAVAVDNNGMPLDHNLTLRRRFYRHGDQDPAMAAAAALISEVPDDGTVRGSRSARHGPVCYFLLAGGNGGSQRR